MTNASMAVVLVIALAICLVIIAFTSTLLAGSNDDHRLPYATLTPTRGSSDIIRYDISDVAGRADYKDMTIYVGQGNDGDDIWSEAKFAIGESGYYEANLTVADATYRVVVVNLDKGTLLSDGNYLELKRMSGPFEDGVPYLLRLRDGDNGVFITSSSYYSP